MKGGCAVRIRIWWNSIQQSGFVLLLLLGGSFVLQACTPQPSVTPLAALTDTPPAVIPEGMSPETAASLQSLTQVDDYPLFTMHYEGDYRQEAYSNLQVATADYQPRRSWGCSLFASLADPENMLFGRNFDWQYSPALLLFTYPTEGYASVAMVDIEYLGFSSSALAGLAESALEDRIPLLSAPFLPFDGMNEKGLVIGMAAVPPGNIVPEPGKPMIGSLGVIREMLDRAQTIDEAVEIMQGYNVNMEGGPALHYLIADATGKAVLVEYSQGKMVLIPSQLPWHLATNFLCSEAGDEMQGHCGRYDQILARLAEKDGKLTSQEAMHLLDQVSQDNTQWSVVYQMNKLILSVKMGRDAKRVYEFKFERSP
jgi:hypothetical protein